MNLDVFTTPVDPHDGGGREIFNPENAWPDASDRVFVATYRASRDGIFQYGFDPVTGMGWVRSLPEPGAVWTPWYNSANPPPPIQIDSLTPPSMVVGGPDQVLVVTGSGFTSASKINFNGGDEPTTFVSATELRTLVKPSTAWGPITLPIYVRNYQRVSNTVPFSFTEAARATRRVL